MLVKPYFRQVSFLSSFRASHNFYYANMILRVYRVLSSIFSDTPAIEFFSKHFM